MNGKINKKYKTKNMLFEIMITSLSIFTTALLLISISSPIVFDFKTINIYSKILMIAGTLFSLWFLISLIIFNVKEKKAKKINFICIMVLSFFIWCMSILHYISFDFWGIKLEFWVGFIFVLCLIVIFEKIYGIVKGISKNIIIDILLAFNLFIYFIGLLVYLTSKSCSYIKIGIGLSYVLIVTYLIYNFLIKKERLTNDKHLSIVTKVLLFIIFIIATIFTFPLYINWIGLKGQNFEYFITIYSCLIGGIITLAGVAWTIKNQENVRKEEQKLLFKPYFTFKLTDEYETAENVIYMKRIEKSVLANGKKDKNLLPNEKYFYLKNFELINTDYSNFIIEKYEVNNNNMLDNLVLINKQEKIIFKSNVLLINEDKTIPIFKIYIKDFLGNHYEYNLIFDIIEKELPFRNGEIDKFGNRLEERIKVNEMYLKDIILKDEI